MSNLRVLLLADDKPGHYHLAEGVIAAIARRRGVETVRLTVARRRLLPARLLAGLYTAGRLSPQSLLRYGYGIDPAALPAVGLVVSAGGDTMLANAAAARVLGVANVFCGTLRKLPPDAFSAVVSSYERHRSKSRHIVALKPSKLDPDILGRPARVPTFGAANPPRLAGLLIGGDSGLFHYEDREWDRLLAFARALSQAWGTRWLVSTSRRSSGYAAAAAAALAEDHAVVTELVDYKSAGPGSLDRIFARADVILCSEDSSTMISEAISARLPVVGVSPRRHGFKPEEAEYRRLMLREGWARFLPIDRLDVDRFAAALGEITPLQGNPLDRLADQLAAMMPELLP
jgi:hypothetical protein